MLPLHPNGGKNKNLNDFQALPGLVCKSFCVSKLMYYICTPFKTGVLKEFKFK